MNRDPGFCNRYQQSACATGQFENLPVKATEKLCVVVYITRQIF